ncbi:MAG: MFS transporter [Candidatus Cloacimonadaceae bacterium]|jgi:MFS family permease|nr:MFS transporter [Candidatus Cloacimonadota bacterium]MDY0126776.1 MFS transporter [Candidatus Cloacimonadaceae bacterium]MCB5254242.1 MFS transporter [Candidatus Cloacimonadota bacterium]MCK9177523.1 MFS transporter [Candidatus Cloacimonadota bacterium]MCK9242901.1 MFS transporter [Candidatus Cloacimonadota bacterium]
MIRFLKRTFISLSIRNYRLFFSGQAISLIGTWIQRTTMGWYVYRLTNSAFLLGLVTFLSMIPSLFISPFVGAWSDRWNRHKVLIYVQIAFLVQNTILAALVLTNVINSELIYPLLLLAALQGIIVAFDSPVRQTLLIDLIGDKKKLPNAIATNSAMFNGARLIGPALGGVLIILFSEGVCFAINAVTYLPVIITLNLIRISYPKLKPVTTSTINQIIDGYRYVYRSFPIRFLIMNLAVYTMFAFSYSTLIPIFAKDVLNGNSGTQGLLMSTAGIGALIGSFVLASKSSIKGLEVRLIAVGVVASTALIVFSRSTSLILSMTMMLFIGFGLMMNNASTNTLLQSLVSDEMRGRVLSTYTTTFMSISPFGALLAGIISNYFGAQFAMMCSAIICLIWSLNGIRLLPRFSKGMLKMLVLNSNSAVYRAPRLRTNP